MRFQRQHVFQERFFHLWIATGHFAIDHFRTGGFLDLAAKFLDMDFAMNAFEVERVGVGFIDHRMSMANYSGKESRHGRALYYTLCKV